MPSGRAPQTAIQRYSRRTRWFHASVYLVTAMLLFTGWWLLTGREGDPSAAARLLGAPDTTVHTWAGWALAVIAISGVLIGARGALTFVRGSVIFRRADLGWFARWPRALVTGRFGHHEGEFDPGQRLANLVMGAGILALIASGAGLAWVDGGAAFVWMLRVHKWATIVVTPVIIGHVVIAAGLAPGYRGVWRSMHLGGALRADVALRLWPAWTKRQVPVTGDRPTTEPGAPDTVA